MADPRPRADESAFSPLHDNVLVRPLMSEERTSSGVVVPDTVRAALNWAEVLAVGPGRRDSANRISRPAVAKGDRVAVRPHSTTEIVLGGERLAVVSERDVLGVLAVPARASRPLPPPDEAAAPEVEPSAEEPVSAMREESLETDVAPDILDRSESTADDLH
jgi:chaperonin GroES